MAAGTLDGKLVSARVKDKLRSGAAFTARGRTPGPGYRARRRRSGQQALRGGQAP